MPVDVVESMSMWRVAVGKASSTFYSVYMHCRDNRLFYCRGYN